MASDVKIAIKDSATALQWLSDVQLINEDYHQAMEDSGKTLEGMKDFADGTMVDEFVSLGSGILTAAKNTFDAIDKIADTVNKVLDITKSFSEGAVGLVGKVINIFN